MVPVSSLRLRVCVLGLALSVTAGPIFFLCLRRTLISGWLNGLVSGLGVATADGFYAAVAGFGISAITTAVSGERRWLALGGGALLVVLGLRIALVKPKTTEAPNATGGGLPLAYASTLGLTITNPATIISFAALAATLSPGITGRYVPPAVVWLLGRLRARARSGVC